jgi:hypothetical protein
MCAEGQALSKIRGALPEFRIARPKLNEYSLDLGLDSAVSGEPAHTRGNG